MGLYSSVPVNHALIQLTVRQLIDDLGITSNPAFNKILAKDKYAGQATHVKILCDVVLSTEVDRSMA
jgi:hypothetical protein